MIAFSRGTSRRSSASRAFRRLSPRETPLPLLTEPFSFLCWDTKPVHHSRRTALKDHPSGLRPLLRGWVTGRQDTRPPYRWIITAGPAEVERLRTLHQLPAGYHNRRRWTDTDTLSESSPDKEPDHHAREALHT